MTKDLLNLVLIVVALLLSACGGDNTSKKDAVHLDGCTAQECWIDEMPAEVEK